MIKELLKKSLFLRNCVQTYHLKKGLPDWKPVIGKHQDEWNSLLHNNDGKNILIATSLGAHVPSVTMESLLAVALTLRNARVHVLLCDAALSACQNCVYNITISEKELAHNGPQKKLCKSCQMGFRPYLELGLNVNRYSEFLSEEDVEKAHQIAYQIDRDDMDDFVHEGINIGEHARAGVLRFYLRGDVEKERYSEEVFRRYFESTLRTVFAMRNFLKKNAIDTAVFHHGIYVPQGPIGDVCRASNVHVVNWHIAYKKSTFIFSHDLTYHRKLLDEPLDWQKIEWNDKLETELGQYLRSRWTGKNDWIKFTREKNYTKELIEQNLSIDFTKPTIGLLTNVIWDAQLHYPRNVFPDMITWLKETIRYFEKRQDIQLLIRIHPAEILNGNPSRQKVMDIINEEIPSLPDNIFIITPENTINTYAAMQCCDSVIIYGTKTGVELTSVGIPVIVAGEAWIKNKNLTIDPKSAEDYFAVLDKLPLNKRLDAKTLEHAKKYAFHFFFRRMIPVNLFTPLKGWPLYLLNCKDLENLKPGTSVGLDTICDGILEQTPFIYPYEKFV